jgi:hypothetical protein
MKSLDKENGIGGRRDWGEAKEHSLNFGLNLTQILLPSHK